MFSILFYGVLIILILYILGYGLTLLLSPKILRPYSVFLMPWFAIIFLILSLVTLSLAGLSVSVVSPFIISFLLVLDLFVIFRTKLKPSINWKELTMVGSIMGAVFILALLPLLRHDKFLTTISMGNNDASVYAVTSDYLVTHSIQEFLNTPMNPLKTGDAGVGNLIYNVFRWGTPILPAFFQNVLNLGGYQLEYLMQVVLFVLCLPLVMVLSKILYKISFLSLGFILIIFGFNANLLYMLFHNFFGQVLFWGLEMFMLIMFFLYFRNDEKNNKKISKFDVITGSTIAVLFLSYHEGAIFIITPLLVLLILKFVLKDNLNNYWNKLFKIGFITILLSFPSIVNAIKMDLMQASAIDAPIGWNLFRQNLPYANPFEMMGFYSIHAFEPLPLLIAVILSIAVILVIAMGIAKSKGKIISLSFVSIYLIFYIWSSILHHNFFAYNRVVTYTLPLILVLFAIGFDFLLQKRRKVMIFVMIILIGLEMFFAIKLVRRFTRERILVEKSFISLSELQKSSVDEPIYLPQLITNSGSYWGQIWTEYFLYPDKDVVSPANFGAVDSVIKDKSLVLIPKDERYYAAPKILEYETVWENEYYLLGRLCNSDKCLLESNEDLSKIAVGKNNYEDSLFLLGWDKSEGDSRWANAEESSLRLVTKDIYTTKLTLEASSLSEPQEVVVYIDNELLGKIKVGTQWKRYSLPIDYFLESGVHKIKLSYLHGYRPMDLIPGNLDGRTLYINLKKISLE